MNSHRILIVDDESSVRELMSHLLTAAGYAVATARDGFEGLLQLKASGADLIISDLNMPNMSGFEFLSVVRRRFPGIPVIAISGAYESGETVPGGVIADAFYPKGSRAPEDLLRTVADVMETSRDWASHHQRQSAPVWIPRNGLNSKGVPFVLITCSECFRSFPNNATLEAAHEIQESPCVFCCATVRYIVDFSVDVISTAKQDSALNTMLQRS